MSFAALTWPLLIREPGLVGQSLGEGFVEIARYCFLQWMSCQFFLVFSFRSLFTIFVSQRPLPQCNTCSGQARRVSSRPPLIPLTLGSKLLLQTTRFSWPNPESSLAPLRLEKTAMSRALLILILVAVGLYVLVCVILFGRFLYEKRRFAQGRRVPTCFGL